jgi:hypothetical protein
MALQNVTQKAFIKALKQNRFNVSKACDVVGVSRQAHYRWLEEDPDYKQAYEDLSESVLDLAEESLIELIQGAYKEVIDKDGNIRMLKEVPDGASIRYYLDRLGKKRGYKLEQTINNNEKLTIERTIVTRNADS